MDQKKYHEDLAAFVRRENETGLCDEEMLEWLEFNASELNDIINRHFDVDTTDMERVELAFRAAKVNYAVVSAPLALELDYDAVKCIVPMLMDGFSPAYDCMFLFKLDGGFIATILF